MIVLCSCGIPSKNLSVIPVCVTPSILFTRMLGRSGFGDEVVCVKDYASDDNQEITSLGGFMMYNYADVCGGKVWLKIVVSVWYDIWKYCERYSAMMFPVTLMCCEYRDVSLLTIFQLIQRAIES